MVLFLKVNKKDAEAKKKELVSKGFYNHEYKVLNEGDSLLFPVAEKVDGEIVEKEAEKINKNTNLKDVLKNELNAEELEFLPASYDIVGDIIIIELSPDMHKHSKLIGEALLKLHKSVTTVLKKASARTGEFRLHELELIAGEDKRETIHKESGVRLKLDVEKVYFSARSSTERLRIANLVKKDEEVLVMFSGCGPFPLVIAKNSEAKYVLGVEKNQDGCRYADENKKLNKLNNVDFMCGDVRDVIKRLGKKFDRICMPLPVGAGEFLDIALIAAKKGTVIHMYDFLDEEGIKNAKKKLEELCKKNNVKCNYLKTQKCGQFSPDLFRVCHDFVVEELK